MCELLRQISSNQLVRVGDMFLQPGVKCGLVLLGALVRGLVLQKDRMQRLHLF